MAFVVRCKPGLQARPLPLCVCLLSCQAGRQAGCRKHLPDELLMLLIVPVDNYTRGERREKERESAASLVTRSLANFMGANKPST